jgi:hypothetical protein
MQHRSDKIGVLYIHFNRFLIKNVVFSLENICALCFFLYLCIKKTNRGFRLYHV